MIKITLKDGSIKEVENGSSVLDVAKAISEGLARVAQCGIVNGNVVDLRTTLNEDCELEICTFDAQEGKDRQNKPSGKKGQERGAYGGGKGWTAAVA